MRTEDLIASTLTHDPGYHVSINRASRAAHFLARDNDAEFNMTTTAYRHYLVSAGYDVFRNELGYIVIRDTGIRSDIYRRYFGRR